MKGSLESLQEDNYGNCIMLHPSGDAMFRCHEKRINWYVERGLAKVISDNPITAQLLFEPKGKGRAKDPFFLNERINQCVICGSNEKLTRHHIIPYCYTKFFPRHQNRHSSYDIVLLCVEHHDLYEESARILKRQLAEKHDAPIRGIGGGIESPLSRANGFAKTLQRYSDQIPEWRVQEMLAFVAQHLGKDTLTLDDLKDFENFNCVVKPTKYHGELVIPHYGLDDFAIMWRDHFLETMKPKYMPDFWDKDRRIYSERGDGPRDQPEFYEELEPPGSRK